jgi:hypothetical protein
MTLPCHGFFLPGALQALIAGVVMGSGSGGKKTPCSGVLAGVAKRVVGTTLCAGLGTTRYKLMRRILRRQIVSCVGKGIV